MLWINRYIFQFGADLASGLCHFFAWEGCIQRLYPFRTMDRTKERCMPDNPRDQQDAERMVRIEAARGGPFVVAAETTPMPMLIADPTSRTKSCA